MVRQFCSTDLKRVLWDTTVIANSDYNITVVALDNAGNSANVTHIISVENPVAPSGDLTGVILIIAAIAAVAGIVIIYIFVLKKR